MTPERWRRIDELFTEALRSDPAEREVWLRSACGGDEGLRAEVARLLDHDEHATRGGFLALSEVVRKYFGTTASWLPRFGRHLPGGAESIANPRARPGGEADGDGFAARGAIRARSGPDPGIEDRSLAQQRLRDLTILYFLIAGMMVSWKYAIMGDPEPTQAIPYFVLLTLLGGIAGFLSSKKPLPPALLKVMEPGIIGMAAAAFAFAQYQAMLDFSLRDDLVRAQFVMKNRVLLTAILILTYGIYAPGNWRRAALIVGPLALLPFATLLTLYLRHPSAMGWLGEVGVENGTTPLATFGFDAMLLLILAAGSASGIRAISRLRRQVMEARELGQYRLGRRIGTGGMGDVYLAEHRLLKRPCALKLIRSDSDSDPKAPERFEREARLNATLSHPNTIEIYDYGRTEDGTYYYVMEYLPGLSLAELVEQHGPLPAGRAVYLLRQVCGALREAHAAGLIHRDIKPSNIFAARRGGFDDVAKLLDFGLVLPVARLDMSPMSGEGRVLGTPLFMSPEQAQGSTELDGRSDIYSLGAVAYYLLTGRPPFDGEDGIELMIAHARDPVVPPSLVRDDIPEDLERVVLRCLAKAPADRYRDAESLECALGACACTADWDQARAARWWGETEQVGPTQRV